MKDNNQYCSECHNLRLRENLDSWGIQDTHTEYFTCKENKGCNIKGIKLSKNMIEINIDEENPINDDEERG